MSSVYTRGNKLYLSYKDASGTWRQHSTGLGPKQKRQAQQMLARLEARIAAGEDFDEVTHGAVTVKRYFERWISQREERGIRSVQDEKTRLGKHAMPHLGHLKMEDVRPRDIQNFVNALRQDNGKSDKPLAPRTMHHVYATLNTMFREAVADELILSNPCKLKKAQLPKKVDKDPAWRLQAVFSKEELELLISDGRIPLVNRVFYATLFLTGARFGEIAALRWAKYEATKEPLGHLLLDVSWDTKTQAQQPLKTEVPRNVPVHPVLATILDDWRRHGWRDVFGRLPRQDDLLIPYPPRQGRFSEDVHWRSDKCRKELVKDCDGLGLRARRVHDTRRTFISLARACGAREDLLRWVTHGRPQGIMNLYSEVPWSVLCGEVSKLEVAYPASNVVELRRADAFDSAFDSSEFSRRKVVEAAGVEPFH